MKNQITLEGSKQKKATTLKALSLLEMMQSSIGQMQATLFHAGKINKPNSITWGPLHERAQKTIG